MNPLVRAERDGDIGVIVLNNPPVNALSAAVVEGLARSFDSFLNDPAIRGIVVIGDGRAFCGGADIKEFVQTATAHSHAADTLNPVLNRIEQSTKPVVAAIHGACLGGGLEVAMACHYRLAAPSAVVGQPEVKLGLIPGAGGTQRLPRLVGLSKAIELCADGNTLRTDAALACGILDAIVTGDLRTEAVRFAREQVQRGVLPRRTCDRGERLGDVSDLTGVREQVRRKAGPILAPIRAMEAVEAAGRLPFSEGLQWEAKLFRECLASAQSKALIHLFFAEREVWKVPGVPRDPSLSSIRRVAVIAADEKTASDITGFYAKDGIPVVGTAAEALTAAELFDVDVIAADCESVMLGKWEAVRAMIPHPEQIVGHYFFCGVAGERLLAIARGSENSAAVAGASLGLAKSGGKLAAVVGVNVQKLLPYLVEATRLFAGGANTTEPAWYATVNECAKALESGIAFRASDIDIIAVYGIGFPGHFGGPMWIADTTGLAVVCETLSQLERERGPAFRPAPLLQQLADTGRTFADYDRERGGT